MKAKYLSFILMMALAACSNKDGESDAYGNFETIETIVSSESSGKLIALDVNQGDVIEKGQLLGMTDTTQLYYGIQQLKAQIKAVAVKKTNVSAQVSVLKEQLSNLKTEQERIHNLFKGKAATQKDIDQIDGKTRELQKQIKSVETQYSSINSEIEVLKAQLDKMEDLKTKCSIVSPVNGTVLEKYLEQGEIAVMGKPVVKVADLSELILKTYISGSQLDDVKIGQQIEVIIDKNDTENQSLKGTISWISPEAEFTPKIIQTKEERVKLVYAMKIRVPNDGRLKIGMPGEVNF